MTAPDYTERRVAIAKAVGLGKRTSGRISRETTQDLVTEPVIKAVPAQRTRGHRD